MDRFYPDEILNARHMKQLLVLAEDAGNKFFEPSTLPCFDKVAVEDRNLDSDFKYADSSEVCKTLNVLGCRIRVP